MKSRVKPALPVFPVVQGRGKTDPDIENSQPSHHAAGKTMIQDATEDRPSQKDGIVGPLRSPGKRHQNYAQHSTHENKQHRRQPPYPYLRRTSLRPLWPLFFPGRGFAGRYGSAGLHVCFTLWLIGRCTHAAAIERRHETHGWEIMRGSWVTLCIRAFYDFRALMRSATSR